MRRSDRGRLRIAWLVTLGPVVAGVTASCTAPEVSAFERYHQSVRTLATEAGSVTANGAATERDAFITQLDGLSGRAAATRVLETLKPRPDPRDSFRTLPPEDAGVAVFIEVERAGLAFERLNAALTRHADLLARLAGGEIASEESLDELASATNAAATDFLGLAGLEAAGNAGRGATGLVSAGAAELFRQFLLGRQSRFLRAAIDAASDDVRSFAALGEVYIEQAALAEQVRTTGEFEEIERLIAASEPGPARRELVEHAIALRARLLQRLSAMEAVRDLYRALPKAFESLSDAAGGRANSFDDLRRLADAAKLVEDRYERLHAEEGDR